MKKILLTLNYKFLSFFNKNLRQNRYNSVLFDLILFFQGKADFKYVIKINDKISFKGNLKNNRYRYLYYERSHEPIETKILQKIISEDSIILDVGANIGWYSLSLATVATKGLVYAFEPVDIVAKELLNNIEFNNIENVIIEKFALSEKEEDVVIYFDSKNWGTTSLKTNQTSNKIPITLKVTSLDKWLEANPLKRIDLIKCDVEGAELSFLKGALKTFETFRPNLMIEIGKVSTNIFNASPSDVIDLLKSFGYTVYNINKNSSTLFDALEKVDFLDESFIQSNFLAVYESKLSVLDIFLIK